MTDRDSSMNNSTWRLGLRASVMACSILHGWESERRLLSRHYSLTLVQINSGWRRLNVLRQVSVTTTTWPHTIFLIHFLANTVVRSKRKTKMTTEQSRYLRRTSTLPLSLRYNTHPASSTAIWLSTKSAWEVRFRHTLLKRDLKKDV